MSSTALQRGFEGIAGFSVISFQHRISKLGAENAWRLRFNKVQQFPSSATYLILVANLRTVKLHSKHLQPVNKRALKTRAAPESGLPLFIMVSPIDEPGTDNAGNPYTSAKEMWRLEAGEGDEAREKQKKEEWYRNGVAYWEVRSKDGLSVRALQNFYDGVQEIRCCWSCLHKMSSCCAFY